ncbi:MAG: hypothetical protein NT085_00720 [candidate division SR1 bacterium]|nr:hypothetical protein [candidate division SR1 bacterium]
MEKKYKKIPKLLRLLAFVSFLGSLLVIFFQWFFLFVIKYAHTLGNDIIGYYRSYFPDLQKMAILVTVVCIIISLIFIFIIHRKTKIKESDQIENNPKIISRKPIKRLFFVVFLSFIGILFLYYFIIYNQSNILKDIPEGYFELSGYDTILTPQDNGFLLTKNFIEKDSTISGFFQNISGNQFMSIQDLGVHNTSGVLTSYITGQAYQDKIDSFVNAVDHSIQAIGQEKVDTFIDGLSGILYTHQFQYPKNAILSGIDDILINNYERNIIGIWGLYYCHKQDYDRCSQYIILQYSFGSALYKGGGGLINTLLGYAYLTDYMETLGLILEKYDIPQQNLLDFKQLLQEPVDGQDIFKNSMLYEHILEINTLQESPASFFMNKGETKKLFDDYIYHLIENTPYIYENQPSDSYLSNLYKTFVYPYLDITGIKNPLGLKLVDEFVPRMNILNGLKARQDILEQLRKSLLEKIDTALQQKPVQNIIIGETGTTLPGLNN